MILSFVDWPSFARVDVSVMDKAGEIDHTSQCLRAAARLSAADLTNFQLDSSSLVAAFRSRIRSQSFGCLPFLATDFVGSDTTLSAL